MKRGSIKLLGVFGLFIWLAEFPSARAEDSFYHPQDQSLYLGAIVHEL